MTGIIQYGENAQLVITDTEGWIYLYKEPDNTIYLNQNAYVPQNINVTYNT